MKRLGQIILIGAFLGFSWLAMQAAHELGHVLGARLTGGVVKTVILQPWVFSRTDVSPNPHPLAVAWAGPLTGVFLPLLLYGLAAVFKSPGCGFVRFFAGFCLLANGVYIGGGSFQGMADAGDLLKHGAPPWLLWLFGILAAALGLSLWNGLGPLFGFGPAGGVVSRSACWVSVALLVVITVVELGCCRPG